ncbi:MAG: winged helix-turn-helix domain-containing protein, partial [Aquabacterium sp.]
MSAAAEAHGRIQFERFELQPGERRLLADGAPVSLGARAFDLLVLMCRRAGHLVTKDEILDAVWPGLVVEENNIAAQVVALRRVLGSGLIATVPGHGYRFTGQPLVVPARAEVNTPPVADGVQLYGRTDDLLALTAALQVPGCVTLIGPAGVGKSALARAVAASWPKAATWVDLAPHGAGSAVDRIVQRALGPVSGGTAAIPQLAAALRGGELLVLDNAE